MSRYRKAAERIVNRYVSTALFALSDDDDAAAFQRKEAEVREMIINQVAAIIDEEVLKAGDAASD